MFIGTAVKKDFEVEPPSSALRANHRPPKEATQRTHNMDMPVPFETLSEETASSPTHATALSYSMNKQR